MSSYEEQRATSDKYLPAAKRIVGQYLLDAAPDEIDWKEATDLWVVKARDMRIAVRIRESDYVKKYKYEFTLRSHLPSGTTTELEKIVNGWGDWMFYGFQSENFNVDPWWLIDLDAFRAALIRKGMNNSSQPTYGAGSNKDGTRFKYFDLRTFPEHPPILIAGSEQLPVLRVAA